MASNDNAGTGGGSGQGGDRPAYGTRADYLEINGGTTTPAAPDHSVGATEGGPELLDRLRGVYGAAPADDEDRSPGI